MTNIIFYIVYASDKYRLFKIIIFIIMHDPIGTGYVTAFLPLLLNMLHYTHYFVTCQVIFLFFSFFVAYFVIICYTICDKILKEYYMNKTGERIRSLRKNKGYTLDRLASEIGTSRQTVHRYENGTISNIPSEKIEAIAKALDTTPSTILGWENDSSAHYMKINPVSSETSKINFSFPEIDLYVTSPDNSMVDSGIYEGDTLLISKKGRPENGQIVLVDINGKIYVRKYFFYKKNGETLFNTSATDSEPQIFTSKETDDFKIIGRVSYVISKK